MRRLEPLSPAELRRAEAIFARTWDLSNAHVNQAEVARLRRSTSHRRRRPSGPSPQVTLRLPDSLLSDLRRQAKRRRMSLSEIIRERLGA